MSRPPVRKWVPKNPKKYVGDANNIVSRSSWETKAMNFLDMNESVLCWSSEEFSINYISPLDSKIHRYFPDFLIKLRTRSGEERTHLVEVKPNHERSAPTTKNKKRFMEQSMTYAVNCAKWRAAEDFCTQKGITFMILDEYDLGIKKGVAK